MTFTILTLFPDSFQSLFSYSILKRLQGEGIIDIRYINLRDFATDSYRSVDDTPYGGGHGMILRVDIVDKAIKKAKEATNETQKTLTILLDPRGTPYSQTMAKELSVYDHLILVCGHYEGVDERIRSRVDMQLSIGDYILTGGEIPAAVVVDSVSRLLPGALATPESSTDESFTENLLEYPQYTKPQTYEGEDVPEILLSGHHKHIQEWRQQQAKEMTKLHRPDLLDK